jgi:hypothetical protein
MFRAPHNRKKTPFYEQNGCLLIQRPSMFPYDQLLFMTAGTHLQSIADALKSFEAIETSCVYASGLKWSFR